MSAGLEFVAAAAGVLAWLAIVIGLSAGSPPDLGVEVTVTYPENWSYDPSSPEMEILLVPTGDGTACIFTPENRSLGCGNISDGHIIIAGPTVEVTRK